MRERKHVINTQTYHWRDVGDVDKYEPNDTLINLVNQGHQRNNCHDLTCVQRKLHKPDELPLSRRQRYKPKSMRRSIVISVERATRKLSLLSMVLGTTHVFVIGDHEARA